MASSKIYDADQREAEWQTALARNQLPPFVRERLNDAREGREPWIATMTPAELLLAKTHGIKPIATVTGTCWYHYGWSWTEGHAEGWRLALDRIGQEAIACGANAVIDVRMRTIAPGDSESMDFSLVGTAVRFENLPASKKPVIATVPALEFVRLLEMGIVPVGLAVGARYAWLQQSNWRANLLNNGMSWSNTPLPELGGFWESIRRDAHADLRRHAAEQGNGVLADVHFGQLLEREGDDKQPPRYLGRHIVIGTVVDTPRFAPVPHGIHTVVDMRDETSPLRRKGNSRHNSYENNEREGGI